MSGCGAGGGGAAILAMMSREDVRRQRARRVRLARTDNPMRCDVM